MAPPGRGGWWLSYFAASPGTIADEFGREAAIAMQRAMFATVDEVGRVVAEEGIDARYHKGGVLTLATSAAQLSRLQAEIEHERAWGFGEADYAELSADETARRLRVDGCLGAIFSPHCASVDPARLARGRRGGRTTRRDHLRAQPGAGPEAARGGHAGRRGQGGRGRERPRRLRYDPARPRPRPRAPLFGDDRHRAAAGLVLGRRRLVGPRVLRRRAPAPDLLDANPDDRIALGGRGAPYHFGSRVKDQYDLAPGCSPSCTRC